MAASNINKTIMQPH